MFYRSGIVYAMFTGADPAATAIPHSAACGNVKLKMFSPTFSAAYAPAIAKVVAPILLRGVGLERPVSLPPVVS
jgi:hypothetical protein